MCHISIQGGPKEGNTFNIIAKMSSILLHTTFFWQSKLCKVYQFWIRRFDLTAILVRQYHSPNLLLLRAVKKIYLMPSHTISIKCMTQFSLSNQKHELNGKFNANCHIIIEDRWVETRRAFSLPLSTW